MRTNMDKTGPSDLYRSITEPEGWRERDKAHDLKWCMNMAAHEAAAGDPPMGAGGDLWMTVHEAERLAALWCAGQPLDDLPQWRTAMQVLARELADTRAALKKANDHAERFEREWYLRGDALETALAAKNEAETRELKAAQEADELRAELAALREQFARFTPLRAKGVVDADDNLDCWDTNPYENCTRHVAALNEKDPAAMWRVVDLFARDEG